MNTDPAAAVAPAATVSTHVLDTSAGRPAVSVGVELSARTAPGGAWTVRTTALTDADGRCAELPALPREAVQARLHFDVERYLGAGPARAGTPSGGPGAGPVFFPEVTVVFAVAPGEHHHVPLLLNPFGYSVYRGS